PRGYIPKRFILSLLLHLGLFVVYALRVCISVAAAAPSAHALPSNSSVPTEVTGVSMYTEYSWTNTEQGIILGSFFNGYITTQIIGGILARRYGGKSVLFGGVLLASLFTFLTPPASKNFTMLVICRTLMGAVEGVSFPAILTIIGHWAPAQERSTMVGFVYAGAYTGNVVTFPLSAWIMDTYGWRTIFYFFACLGFLWCLLFHLFTTSTPSQHRSMHAAELNKILATTQVAEDVPATVPWKKILVCMPAWALFVVHTCFNWAFYTLLTQLPSYMALVLGFNMQQSGFLSSMPYLFMFIVSILGGMLADWTISRGLLSRTRVRKTWMVTSLMVPACCLVLCGYASSWPVAIFFMTCALGFSGLSNAGYSANYLEISAGLSGILISLGNTLATVPGMVSPVLTGVIMDAHGCSIEHVSSCQQAYQTVFWIAFMVYTFGAVFYATFATSE
ncbi:hypothetical protein GUITHDRAFT_42162, partial [Guillardia theta CCMP2712]